MTIWGDTTPEPDESFSVEVTKSQTGTPPSLSEPYPIADGHAVITLRNDDVQPPPAAHRERP